MSGSGACTCSDTTYVGVACQYSNAVTCNGHGQVHGDGSCTCDAGYAGASCNQCAADHYGYPTCSFCLATTTCSGHGSCAPAGGCACDAGFVPPDCQTICGDVDDSAQVDASDLALFRLHLANPVGVPFSPGGASKCSVIGTATSCDVADVVVIARSLHAPPLAPGRAPVCSAVTGP